MKIEIVEDWDKLSSMSSVWNDLVQRSAAHQVFQSWEWLQAWRSATHGRITPRVICVYSEQGELVGLLPLWQVRMKLFRVIELNVLRYLGDSCNAFEYPAPILDPELREPVLAKLKEGLARMSGWDLVWLPNCSDQPGLTDCISALVPAQGVLKRRPAEFSRFNLPNTWDAYEQAIGSQQRQKNRRLVRKFVKLGGDFEQCDELSQVDEYLARLIELHNSRWHSVGQPGTFSNRPAVTTFYREFLPVAFEKGWLFMTGYRLEGQLVAVQFGLRFDETYMQIQEGFDPELPSGLGNALRYVSLEKCISAGVRVYDFLGGHTEHKRRWGGQCHEGFDAMIISGRNPLIKAALQRVWPTGRWIIDPSRQLLNQSAS